MPTSRVRLVFAIVWDRAEQRQQRAVRPGAYEDPAAPVAGRDFHSAEHSGHAHVPARVSLPELPLHLLGLLASHDAACTLSGTQQTSRALRRPVHPVPVRW